MFIKAKANKKNGSVTYINDDGSTEARIGGQPAWRYQNPGNLKGKLSDWAKRHGAIGSAGGFLVFPSYEVGKQAMVDLLSGPTYADLSIWDAIPKYSPKEDKNDVDQYRKLVAQKSGLDLKRTIRSLSKEEFMRMVNAMEKVESGYKPGKIVETKAKVKISKVRKDKKGTITDYFVAGMGWISKGRAIALVRAGKVDGVVARSRAGNLYVKTHRDRTVINNLENMG